MIEKPIFLTLCAGVAFLSFAGPGLAQLPTSKLGNANPVQLAAGSTTLVGVPGLGAAGDGDGGVVTASAGNTVTVATASFPAVGANTHTLVVGTGASAGAQRTVQSSTATTVTYFGAPLVLDVGVDQVELVPCLTLGTAFGSPPSGINGAPVASAADIVIVDGVRYYFRTGTPPFGNAWQLEIGAPVIGGVGNTVIPKNAAPVVIKRTATSTEIPDSVAYTCPKVQIEIAAGTNTLSWPFPGDVTLDQSGLAPPCLTGAPVASAADIVIAGGVRYFFRTGAPPFGGVWQPEIGAPVIGGVGGTVLNPGGQGFIVLRSTGGAITCTATP